MGSQVSATSTSQVRQSQVVATETAGRVTPTNGPTFKEVMKSTGNMMLRGAESAVRSLPMGAVVAASVRGPGQTPGHAPAAGVGLSAAAATNNAEGYGTGTVGSGAVREPGVESALQQSQDMNLYFLELQERMAAENRAFSTYSNVLKARHETVKNAIGNIR